MKHSLLQTAIGLYRIVAGEDNPTFAVSKGQLGGLVSNPDNLSQDGLAWIAYNASCTDGSRVLEDAYVGGNALLAAGAVVAGQSYVTGDALLEGCVTVRDAVTIDGTAVLLNNAVVKDAAHLTTGGLVRGNSVISGTSTINQVVKRHAKLHDVQQFEPISTEMAYAQIAFDFVHAVEMSNQSIRYSQYREELL